MRVLLTGAGGFIGSTIADLLLARGDEVVPVDLLLPKAHGADRERRPQWAPDNLILGDIRDPELVRRLLPGVDVVCHQAAMVGLGVDAGDAPDYAGHNVLGTAVLLAAMAATGVRSLVQASSMVVYGEGRYLCARHGDVRPGPRLPEALTAGEFDPPCAVCGASLRWATISEDAPLDPRNTYAASKLAQEHFAAAWARQISGAVTSLRYHNVYGPRMPRDTPYAGVASIFASSLAGGRAPQVFEDGGQTRDFVHVRDVARANLRGLLAEEPVPGAFNVCSGHPRTVGDMARALHAAYAPGTPEPEVTGQYRLGDVRHVFASAERAREVLGFSAVEEFDAGMVEFASAPLRAPAAEG